MNIKRICRALAAPSIFICIFAVLGIAGAIENGASLSNAWWAFGSIALTWAILCGASSER